MTVILTGFAGFIGSQILRDLILKGCRVIGIDNLSEGSSFKNYFDLIHRFTPLYADIADPKLLEYLKSVTSEVDFIINCAADSHVDRSWNQVEKFVKSNVLGSINMARIGMDYKVKKFVYVNSVVGSTPVLVKKDNEIQLKAIVELENWVDYEVLTVDQEGKLFFAPVKGWVKHYVPEIYKISYTGGEISTSASHSVFVFEYDAWVEKKVKDLKVKDMLVTFSTEYNKEDFEIDFGYISDFEDRRPCHKKLCTKDINLKFKLSDDLIWLIGFYLAEGCASREEDRENVRQHYCITWTQKDKNVLEKVKKILNNHNPDYLDKYQISEIDKYVKCIELTI